MKKLGILTVIILVLVIIISGAFLFYTTSSNQQQDAAVLEQIRSLNRWETSSYTMQQVIDQSTSGNIFQQFLFGEKILLVAQGTVIGGFDLSNLSSKSISIQGKNIQIKLPAPKVLSTNLNDSQTKVYDQQKGLLVPQNTDLESQARIAAENKIQAAACSAGIMQNAASNANNQLTGLFKSLGFTTISITIPNGHC